MSIGSVCLASNSGVMEPRFIPDAWKAFSAYNVYGTLPSSVTLDSEGGDCPSAPMMSGCASVSGTSSNQDTELLVTSETGGSTAKAVIRPIHVS